MYSYYKLEVYDYVQKKWINHANHAYGQWGNGPYRYDDLRKEFDRLVNSAQDIKANEIGYRIIQKGNGDPDENVLDCWTNK